MMRLNSFYKSYIYRLDIEYLGVFVLCCLLFFAFSVSKTHAKTETVGDFELTYSDPLFAVANAAPGDVYDSNISIRNLGANTQNLQFLLGVTADPKILGDYLFLKINGSEGNCLWGCVNDQSVSKLNKAEVVFSDIAPGPAKAYELVLTFDAAAGNELQDAKLSFDLTLGYQGAILTTSSATSNGGGGGGRGRGGGGGGGGAGAVLSGTGFFGGPAGTGIIGGAEASQGANQEGEVQGESTAPGQVEGASVASCVSWPKWIWILAILAYFAAFLWRTFENLEGQAKKREIRWKWQFVLAVAAFLFWYFFDFCRVYLWFVVAAIVGGAIIYLYYLNLMREKIRGEQMGISHGGETAKDSSGVVAGTKEEKKGE